MSIKSTLPSFASDPNSALNRVRRHRKISVEELARRSGVAAPTIRRCERFVELPHDAELFALAKALQVKVAVLLGNQPFVTESSATNQKPSPEFLEQTQHIQRLFGASRG